MEYQYQVKTTVSYPTEYGTHALESTRRKAGNDLYNLLYSQRLPAVVDIDESSTEIRDQYSRELENVTTITISVTPVTHKHITVTHMDMSLAHLPIQSGMKFSAEKYLRELWYKIIRRK